MKVSGENEIRWSLNEFPDGQRFVKVVAAQSLFDGLTLKEQTDLATRIIKSKFQGKVVGIDNKTFVNGVTANEYTHPSKHIEEDVYTAKIRASAELDNLIDAGYNFRKGDDGKDGHLHSEAVDGFDYFDVIFYLGGEYYQGLINIINNKRGKRLKDITKIKNITKDMVSRYGANPSYTFLRDTSMNSIPDSAENVNTSDEKSSEKISEGRSSLSDTEQREELARAFEGLAKTEAERDIVNAYRKEINKIGERIEQREKLIIRLKELEGRRGFAGERSELRVRISELTDSIKKADGRLFELEAAKPFKQLSQRARSQGAATKPGTAIIISSYSRRAYALDSLRL